MLLLPKCFCFQKYVYFQSILSRKMCGAQKKVSHFLHKLDLFSQTCYTFWKSHCYRAFNPTDTERFWSTLWPLKAFQGRETQVLANVLVDFWLKLRIQDVQPWLATVVGNRGWQPSLATVVGNPRWNPGCISCIRMLRKNWYHQNWFLKGRADPGLIFGIHF